MKLATPGMTKRIAPLFVLLTLLVWSCDLFENDVVPDENDVTLGQTDFYTIPNSSAVIDLKSLVKSYTQVSLVITDQPGHGDLNKINDAVFSYKPDKNFKGRDFFMIDIRSKGVSVLKDSIIITVEHDTTSLPCGLYAVQDSLTITAPGAQVVTIDVLDNDRICGIDKNDVNVSIFSYPLHGLANLTESNPAKINYTIANGFAGYDSFIYKISDSSDSSVYSLGLVTIFVYDDGTCESELQGDHFVFERGPSAYVLNVFLNDRICSMDSVNDEFTIIDGANFGTAMPEGMGIIHYLPDPLANFAPDTLRYRYCHNSICYEAGVRISFTETPDSCFVLSGDTTVNLPLNSPNLMFGISIVSIDRCDGPMEIGITKHPVYGSATISNGGIIYEANSATSPSDSLNYKVCDQFNACVTGTIFVRRE